MCVPQRQATRGRLVLSWLFAIGRFEHPTRSNSSSHPGDRQRAFEILQDSDLQSVEAEKRLVKASTVHQKKHARARFVALVADSSNQGVQALERGDAERLVELLELLLVGCSNRPMANNHESTSPPRVACR